MVEPTESEDLTEINRFVSAMRQIAKEINEIRNGQIKVEESALRNAPHTAAALLKNEWTAPYSRETAAYPMNEINQPLMGSRNKYWPGVGRIDGAHGDRNLICACPPVSSFQD